MGCLNTSFRLIFCSAIFTLVQGIIWMIFSILGILLYQCKISASNNGAPSYLIYLLYFFNKECGTPPEFLLRLESKWPTAPVDPAERTYAFAITYLVCNILWTLSSSALAVAVYLNRQKYTQTPWYVYFAWIFFTILVLINDLVATSHYGYDFIETSSLGGLLGLLGVHTPNWEWATLVPLGYRTRPASATAVMMVVCSKFFLLWIADVVLVGVIVRAARRGELVRRRDEISHNKDIMRSQTLLPVGETTVKDGPDGARSEEQQEMQQLSDETEGDLSLEPLRTSEEDHETSTQPRASASEGSPSSKQESSVVSRLSEVPAPENLRNQLPWRYPQPSSTDVARLSKRNSNSEIYTTFKKPTGDSISEAEEGS